MKIKILFILLLAVPSCASNKEAVNLLSPDKVTFGHNLDNHSESIGFHWNLPKF